MQEFASLAGCYFSDIDVWHTGMDVLNQVWLVPLYLVDSHFSYVDTKPVNEGTGIGLSIVNRFIREYRGAVHMSTQQGRGTTFTVYLPQDPHIGVSQRIEDETERKTLKEKLEQILPADETGGYIVRTVAETRAWSDNARATFADHWTSKSGRSSNRLNMQKAEMRRPAAFRSAAACGRNPCSATSRQCARCGRSHEIGRAHV